MSFVARFHKRYGTRPVEPAPKLEGVAAGRKCILVAGARCVFDDLAQYGIKMGGHLPMLTDVMTVNDIVMHLPLPVAHHYSNDHRLIQSQLTVRKVRCVGNEPLSHSCRVGATFNWPWPGHGTSALGATYTALALGYDSIVLCGVPLDNSGHYFDPPSVRTTFTEQVSSNNGELQYWSASTPLFDDKVRSMSGRTAALLGQP